VGVAPNILQAESRCITTVRRHIRDERGLPPTAVSMTGYWRLATHER
jgi:NADPH-dependent ferric siderophore reductase